MEKQIVNAKIVLENEILTGGVCRYRNGIIDYIGTELKNGIDTVDIGGMYLLPGFIDIHCHGGAGLDFMDATPSQMLDISRFHLSHGTTTLVATTLTDSWDAICSALANFAAIPENQRLSLHGVHLEGPWLSPSQCGAQSIVNMEIPNSRTLLSLLEKYPFIERVSLAPELDMNFEVGRILVKHGRIASVAHTDADFDTVIRATENGYSLMTHLYSGMAGVTRKNAYRTAGAVEAGLYDDRLFVEVIADGKHLPDGLLKLIYKCKGRDGIALVTDAMRGAGLPEGTETTLGKLSNGVGCIIEDGVAKLPDRQSFAGSVATMDRLLRVMHSIGVSLTDCSAMLSATPAKIMGYNDRGRIAVGLRADFVVVDKSLNIKKTILKGQQNVS